MATYVNIPLNTPAAEIRDAIDEAYDLGDAMIFVVICGRIFDSQDWLREQDLLDAHGIPVIAFTLGTMH